MLMLPVLKYVYSWSYTLKGKRNNIEKFWNLPERCFTPPSWAVFTHVAQGLVPRNQHKMVLCSDTGYQICWYVHIQQTEHMPTASKVWELHHACVPCSIYLLDFCFLRFLYFFHVVFLYETLKRPNGLRRQAMISGDCHGNLRCHFKKTECFPYW